MAGARDALRPFLLETVTITIRNLRLQVILGVNESERHIVREVVVNLRLEFDGAKAAASDNLADTIDYKALRDRILDVAKDTKFHLIEALVEHIGTELRRDARITSYFLEIDKPGALRLADSVSVSATWNRASV